MQKVYKETSRGDMSKARQIVTGVMRYIAVVAGAMTLVLASTPLPVSAQQSASMTLSGPTAVNVGDIVSVEIRVKTSVLVNAVQADVTFPTSLFAYDSIYGDNSAFPSNLIASSANGTATIVRAIFTGGNGDMIVATLRLKGIKEGRGEIKLLDSSMATDADTSENVVSVRQGLTIQVGSPSVDSPVEQGPNGGTNGGGTQGGGVTDPANPSVTPTIDPSASDDDVDSNGSVVSGDTDGNGRTDTTTNSSSISPAAWIIIVASILLVTASVFFSVNLLKKRGRRAAAYQNYMQPPVNSMYNQGQVYDLQNIGYTRQYQGGSYQQQSAPVGSPAQPQNSQPNAGAYSAQYPQYTAQYPAPQAVAQPPAKPSGQIYQPEQSFSPNQHNQSPW